MGLQMYIPVIQSTVFVGLLLTFRNVIIKLVSIFGKYSNEKI